MSKLTKSAKLRSCTVRLPGCRNEVETVVFAHAPSIDSGLGFKSPDWWGAYSCHHCHDILDGRKSGLMESCGVKSEVWLCAIFETQSQMFREGLLRVDE